MNSSNSFNVCTRCGNSNAMSAKYCSRCGAQLKVPDEPIECHNCHTHNTPMANFCRNCGTPLKVGSATKICPKCGNVVNAEDNVCVCGYSFVTLQQTEQNARADSTAKRGANEKVYDNKGGRALAIAALAMLLIFAFYVFAPALLHPEFLQNADGGFLHNADGALYGYDSIALLFKSISSNGDFSQYIEAVGGAAIFELAILTVVFIATVVAQMVVCIMRICSKERPKHINWYYLALAIVSTVLIVLIVVLNSVSSIHSSVTSAFGLADGNTIGYASLAIPIYYWLFFAFSIFAKAKALKEVS